MEPQCGECKYWVYVSRMERAYGECRRHPPSISQGQENFGVWYWTLEDEWCGEFRPKLPGE